MKRFSVTLAVMLLSLAPLACKNGSSPTAPPAQSPAPAVDTATCTSSPTWTGTWDTFTFTATSTPTLTPTPTFTPSDTPTPSFTGTQATDTPTPSPTDSPTDTSTDTPTESPTNSPTPSPTDSPTDTSTDTPVHTSTPTPSPTDTDTSTPTSTPTETPTDTSTPTPTDSPTSTPTPTSTFTSTHTPTATDTPTVTETFVPTWSVVINKVYGGGSASTGAAWRADFVELINRSDSAVGLSTWSLCTAAYDGTVWTRQNLSGTVPPHSYFLIQMGPAGANGAVLPTPDVVLGTGIDPAHGKLLLQDVQTVPSGACPADAHTVDLVGYGDANCHEGPGPAGTPSDTAAAVRNPDCRDTNDNASDFLVTASFVPKNSTTSGACGAPSNTPTSTSTPTDTSTDTPTSTPTDTPTSTNTPTPTVTNTFGCVPFLTAGKTSSAGSNTGSSGGLWMGICTLPSSASVKSLHIYITQITIPGTMRLALYDAGHAVPILVSEVVTAATGWNDVPVTVTEVPAGTYFVAARFETAGIFFAAESTVDIQAYVWANCPYSTYPEMPNAGGGVCNNGQSLWSSFSMYASYCASTPTPTPTVTHTDTLTSTPTPTLSPTLTPTLSPTLTSTRTFGCVSTAIVGNQGPAEGDLLLDADTVYFSRIVPATGGIAGHVVVYTGDIGGGASMQVGLYSDDAAHGRPGAMLAQAAVSPAAFTWNDATIPPVAYSAGATYWIAMMRVGSPYIFTADTGTAGTSNRWSTDACAGPALPDPADACLAGTDTYAERWPLAFLLVCNHTPTPTETPTPTVTPTATVTPTPTRTLTPVPTVYCQEYPVPAYTFTDEEDNGVEPLENDKMEDQELDLCPYGSLSFDKGDTVDRFEVWPMVAGLMDVWLDCYSDGVDGEVLELNLYSRDDPSTPLATSTGPAPYQHIHYEADSAEYWVEVKWVEGLSDKTYQLAVSITGK